MGCEGPITHSARVQRLRRRTIAYTHTHKRSPTSHARARACTHSYKYAIHRNLSHHLSRTHHTPHTPHTTHHIRHTPHTSIFDVARLPSPHIDIHTVTVDIDTRTAQ